MRKFLIPFLMASAAVTPTLAHAQDSRDDRRAARQHARSERASARDDSREERVSLRRQSSDDDRRVRVDRQRSADDRVEVRNDRVEMRQERMDARASGDVRRQQVDIQRGAQQQRSAQRGDRLEDRQAQRAERQARYQAVREARRSAPPPRVSTSPAANTQPPAPTGARAQALSTLAKAWRKNNWRNDHRYDWYRHRNRNWWLYSLGFYSDPFGWGYSPYSIGWRMWPSYYSRNYWLNDPWQYRLPFAPAGTQWIRYYDDAILVDMWSGQVVDVIYDFFW